MKKTIISFLILCLAINSNAQMLDFHKMESIIPYLDNRTFEVPKYGYITFHFDKKMYKSIRDKVSSKSDSDIPSDIPFDLEVKRYNSKKSEGEYPTRVLPVINAEGNHWKVSVQIGEENIASTGSSLWMSSKRKDAPEFFPLKYFLLADGELFFEQIEYEKISFDEYKKRLLSMYNALENPSSSSKSNGSTDPVIVHLVKCLTSNK